MIQCKDLCLRYPDGTEKRTIFDHIDLDIKKGDKVVLLGPSGSGKSSLIYLLSSLRKPTSGKIYYKDLELTGMNDNKTADIRKQNFSFIFQMHYLLPYLTTLENVLVAKNNYSKENKELASELLTKLGMEKHLHKKVHQMSGGERQRVAIARALINNPDIIFADEPTASLDHKISVEVFDILKNHNKECTLIMATHDTSILSGDERIIRVADGMLKESDI